MIEPLIKRAQSGDNKAFTELVAIYDKKVMAIIYRFSGNLFDRQDLYQDIFLECYKSIKRYQFKSRFETWLTRIALNCCIDYMKRSGPVKEYMEVAVDSVDWERRSKIMAILNALGALEGHQQICFHMYYVESWGLKEIANLLEISEGTVKSHLSRARDKVKLDSKVMEWQTS